MTPERICPKLSRPYVHHIENGGFTDEETRLHIVPCLRERCADWKVCLVEWAMAEGEIADMIDAASVEAKELNRILGEE
jgi:hypothetical protein